MAESKKVILCGPAGSGKTYGAGELIDNWWAVRGAAYKMGTSYTTRPMRAGEINRVEYYFVTDKEFDKLDLYESVSHGKYRYGLTNDEMAKKSVFIMNPAGIATVRERGDRDKFIVVYLNPPLEVRRTRCARRGWSEEQIDARNVVDDAAFDGFLDYDHVEHEPEFLIAGTVLEAMYSKSK